MLEYNKLIKDLAIIIISNYIKLELYLQELYLQFARIIIIFAILDLYLYWNYICKNYFYGHCHHKKIVGSTFSDNTAFV